MEYYSVDWQHLKTVIGEPCDGERLSDDCFSEADGVMANNGERADTETEDVGCPNIGETIAFSLPLSLTRSFVSRSTNSSQSRSYRHCSQRKIET